VEYDGVKPEDDASEVGAGLGIPEQMTIMMISYLLIFSIVGSKSIGRRLHLAVSYL